MGEKYLRGLQRGCWEVRGQHQRRGTVCEGFSKRPSGPRAKSHTSTDIRVSSAGRRQKPGQTATGRQLGIISQGLLNFYKSQTLNPKMSPTFLVLMTSLSPKKGRAFPKVMDSHSQSADLCLHPAAPCAPEFLYSQPPESQLTSLSSAPRQSQTHLTDSRVLSLQVFS